MATRLLTTGQAAKSCSVTPDTVLKWIRSGVLPARRTAGGHHRIDQRDLQRVLSGSRNKGPVRAPSLSQEDTGARRHRAFRYCWEFNGKGKLLDTCKACAVYQMRALRCYEVARLAPDADHPRAFCEGRSCVDCEYYRKVHGQSVNVLVVSDDADLAASLLEEPASQPFNLEISDCEYTCSATVDKFRPDFAIVDCSMGRDRSRDIACHLCEDPRIPFVRVVLAGNEGEFPTECDKEVFARIQRPFSAKDIADCISWAGRAALGA